MDCVVTAVAKKVVREAHTGECTITLKEFEDKAAAAVAGLNRAKQDQHADYDDPKWD